MDLSQGYQFGHRRFVDGLTFIDQAFEANPKLKISARVFVPAIHVGAMTKAGWKLPTAKVNASIDPLKF